MRTLKECQAEVFRRSKKRLRQHRNRILAACIPLVLCGAAALIYTTADIAPGKSPADGVTIVPEPSGTVVRIEVSGPEGTRTYTDPAQYDEICNYLDSSTNALLKDEAYQESTRGEVDNSDMVTEQEYTITVYYEQGENTVYHFTDNILNNHTENKVYVLTEEEAEALEAALRSS